MPNCFLAILHVTGFLGTLARDPGVKFWTTGEVHETDRESGILGEETRKSDLKVRLCRRRKIIKSTNWSLGTQLN